MSTNQLSGELGVIEEEKAPFSTPPGRKNKIGMHLFATNSNQTFFEDFECGPFVSMDNAIAQFEVTGSVIGKVDANQKLKLRANGTQFFEEDFTASGDMQKPEQFGGGSIDVLSTKVTAPSPYASPGEQTGLKLVTENETEEPALEISSVQ